MYYEKTGKGYQVVGSGVGHSGDDTVLYRVFAPSHIERLAFKLNLKESAEA